jgi:hypothetical protein
VFSGLLRPDLMNLAILPGIFRLENQHARTSIRAASSSKRSAAFVPGSGWKHASISGARSESARACSGSVIMNEVSRFAWGRQACADSFATGARSLSFSRLHSFYDRIFAVSHDHQRIIRAARVRSEILEPIGDTASPSQWKHEVICDQMK